MREIDCKDITQAVACLCKEANFSLPGDVKKALAEAANAEDSPLGRTVLEKLLDNALLAEKEQLPICQDCGLTVVFIEYGQDVRITGGSFNEAIQEGVRKAYVDGFLRKSIVRDPVFSRINTKDNTPAVIHTEIVEGCRLKITVLPKGGGSENMSALAMLKPSQGVEGVKEFVVSTVEKAGSNPCPPVIVGVGIGGTADKALALAKKALTRPLGTPNKSAEYADLEKELLKRINSLGIGPEGFGGKTTALAVHIEYFHSHIAGLPVGVCIQCNSARLKEAIL
ncbi:MAG: fumarate hydratase [Firmicutes bacterium]|nr:fumarate hydratase [Bacillota bacterium]